MARNPEREFYREEIAAARSERRWQVGRSDPELSFAVGRQRASEAFGGLAREGTAWSVSVSQTFEWPGRLALRRAIADRDVELAELGFARFESALIARAQQLAYGLHASHTMASAVREVAERFSALKETFVAREPAGIAPMLETRIVEAAELTLQRRAAAAELAVQQTLLELNQLRGAPPDAPLRVAAVVPVFAAAPENATLLESALARNFEFRQKRLELERQGYSVRLARHERYPALGVAPYYAQENAGERESTVGVEVSVPWPIGARSRGALELAEARRRQAETAVLLARRELEREVLTAALAYRLALAEIQLWPTEAADRFRAAAALADRHYRMGAVPVGTYIELQQSYLEAVEAVLATHTEALAAAFRLRQLTGSETGWVTLSTP